MKASHHTHKEETLVHDWKIILSIFALLVLVIAGFHAYFMYRVNAGDIFSVNTEARDESIIQQKKTVRRVNEFFEKRQVATEAAEGGEGVRVVDPSL